MIDQSHPNHKWLAMLGIGLGVFMATLNSSIVNISLPTLQEVFHTNFATIQWVALSYALVLTSLMLTVARFGDMMDKKRIYIIGLILFTIFSLANSLSRNVYLLITFRAFQGLGATMMQALGTAIITEIFPASMRGRALGMIGGIVSMGIAIGPPLGGILIGAFGWPSVFLVNVPVGIFTYFIIRRFVPHSHVATEGQRFDRAGAAIMFIALTAYALGVTIGQGVGFTSPLVIGLLVFFVVGIASLLYVESHIKQPMIDLSLFRNILFGINLLMGFLVFFVLAANFILPFFLELVRGYSAEQVGLMIAAQPVMMGLVAPASGSLSDRFGSRIISLIGLVILVAGCWLMSTMPMDVTPLGFILRMAPLGIGFGMFQSPNNSAIMGAAPRHRLGIASGLLSLSRTLGNVSGLPLMGAIYTAIVLTIGHMPAGSDVTTAAAIPLTGGVQGVYRIAAYIMAGATVLAATAYLIDRNRADSGDVVQ